MDLLKNMNDSMKYIEDNLTNEIDSRTQMRVSGRV
ncbi:Uncharacterised protein [Mycobacteroides abscessus subsp. abscessus]|nr:Uncharacterised protein [Mycobacteroides abscessus subsp. abscessus]